MPTGKYTAADIAPQTAPMGKYTASDIDASTPPPVAGAGPMGTPGIPAAPTPNMQSSLLSPSTYGEAAKEQGKALIKPLLHIPSQIASYPGFVDPSKMGGPIQEIASNPDKGAGVANALTQVGTGMLLGKAFEAAPKVASTARSMAIGNPDAAALQGLKIPAGSSKVLPMQNSVQTARPYLQGANSLEDLQSRIPQAKDEIWSPYKETIDRAGNHPVQGPDGPTTLAALEQERLQLSALNRGLKTRDPESLQLAQQKGMSQAQLLDRERAVTSALDPELSKFGIDPQAIRQNFGAVSRVGNQVSGKSTLLEKPQPYGFGKMANLSLEHPFQAPQQILSGLRDMVAGRPLFSGSPTDIGIREGFRTAGPKPNMGSFAPLQSQKLLGPSIPGSPYSPPYVKQPIVTPPPAAPLLGLPSTAGAGEAQPMIGIRNDYPKLATPFARERVPATVFGEPKPISNGLFTVQGDGQIMPKRQALPAPLSKPRGKKP